MSTAEKLECDAGITGFRQRIQAIRDTVANENKRADDLEKERELAHANYMDTLKTKDLLKSKIEHVRNEILKISKDDVESRIGLQKDIYAQTFKMLKVAEDKKDQLENRLDEMEGKSKDFESRLKYLTLELEYNHIESGRKSQGYKDVSELFAAKEKHYGELEDLVDAYDARILIAQDKISELELRIAETESDIEATQWQREDLHRQFKELIEVAKTDLSYFNIS